jgi:hypothetical protein
VGPEAPTDACSAESLRHPYYNLNARIDCFTDLIGAMFLEDAMSPRTVFLSKLIGLFALITAVSMLSHREQTVQMVRAMMDSPSLLFTWGLLSVAGGLAIILAHNIWSKGALAAIVSFIGWAALIKGLLLLFLSSGSSSELFLQRLHYDQYFYFYTSISLVLGAWLTIGGFRYTQAKG